MNRTSSPRSARGKRPLWITLGLAVLALGYVAAKPALERQLGISLPGLRRSSPSVASPSTSDSPENSPGESPGTQREDPAPAASDPREAKDKGPAAGELTSLPGDVQQSPAGLRYGPGSAEGHRLKHILRHAQDIPNRPGPHGVFEGGQAAIIAVVDEAYVMAERGDSGVQDRKDQGRRIITADMGRRIGFVGGKVGEERGHPAADHLRLVLEGKNVITAYPMSGR